MEVNDELIRKLADLSGLEFREEEKGEIKKDLQQMISFVDKLNELDLEGIEPLIHMSTSVNKLREDEVKGSVGRAEGLKNAPDHDEVYFRVPKVIRNPESPES